jgi:guanylate kinase
VGKGTVVAELMRAHGDHYWLSRSWTTRKRREGESEDAYVFVDRDTFEQRIADGGFVEWAEFLGNLYGTPLPHAPEGKILIYEIDVQGARQVVEADPSAALIFLQAPSAAEQEARLRHRGDPEDNVRQRLEKAAEEADAGAELGAHHIVNLNVEDTVEELHAYILERFPPDQDVPNG